MNEMKTIGIGFILILIGILILWYTSKNSKKGVLSSINNFQGYTGGIGFIIGGIIYILNNLHLW